MKTNQITKSDFLQKISDYETNPTEWKYKGKKPCIVDFYADWCGPSRQISSVLNELAQEYEGKIDIYTVNTEQEEDLTIAFGIRTIPSFLFCPVDKRPKIARGSMNKAEFQKAIKDILFE